MTIQKLLNMFGTILLSFERGYISEKAAGLAIIKISRKYSSIPATKKEHYLFIRAMCEALCFNEKLA